MEEKILENTEQIEEKENRNKAFSKKLLVLLILSAIVVISVAVVSISFVMSKSVEGEWELVVNPEVTQSTSDITEKKDKVFYTFSKPSKYGDGTYKTYYQGGVEKGQYKLSEKDGKELIYLGTKNLEYNITGSKLLGNATLTITYPEYTDEQTGEKHSAEDYVFLQAKAPEYEKESYDDFETNEALLGKWITNERTLPYYTEELSYTQTVEFLDNGIMTIHYESADLALDRYLYYAYTTQNAEITFSLVTDKETKYNVSYDFEKGNLVFTEDKTSASIFADEFFSDATYYAPDNLPESTTEK